jgi:sugar lactone lactonase YvrE
VTGRLAMGGVALLLSVAAGCRDDSTTPTPPSPSAQDGLWTASGSPSAILRLDPSQLSDTGEREPATAVTTPSARLETLVGVAFDAAGDLWIASADDAVLLSFAPEALTSSGSRAARTVVSSTAQGSLRGPTGLAFDLQHRLWVVDNGNGTLNRFDPGQLAAGGPQTPAVVLHVPGSPVAIAFDTGGSLWVSDNQSQVISKYTATQLATSGAPAPALVLGDSAHPLVNPSGLAFDRAGNLWVANTGDGTVVAFSPTQLAIGSNGAPHIVISGSLAIPVGLAFDGDGNLWVVGGTGALTEFARSSLGASGAPAPSARLHVSGHSVFWSVAFWPRPAGLPLN